LKKILWFCILFLVLKCAFAQLSGSRTFGFLGIPHTSGQAILGGSAVSAGDAENPQLFQENPANLDSTSDNRLLLTYNNYLADLNSGQFYYAKHFQKTGTFGLGFSFMNYGKFTRTADNGDVLGEFGASDNLFTLGYGKNIDTLWVVGANLKWILGNYADMSQSALAVDLAGGYRSRNKSFAANLLIKNVGRTLGTNTDNTRAPLPFEISLGMSKKVPKAPFRFHLQYQHLQRWDLSSTDIDAKKKYKTDPETGTDKVRTLTADNIMRHLVFATDIVLGKVAYLSVAYNYRRRAELGNEARSGLAGFAFGLGVQIKRIGFHYALSGYHPAANAHYFSVTTNLNEYLR
jgi:hypothetical protein